MKPEEAFKQWWDEKGKFIGIGGLITYQDFAKAFWIEAAQQAYEDAAKICDHKALVFANGPSECAKAIRQRLQQLKGEGG